jgi:TetR/AcrR family transcriptional regulator
MMKKEATMRKILDAATVEFGEKGYDLASTNQIYMKAGVSKGSIFSHFSTKGDLFFTLYQEKIKSLLDEMDVINFEEIQDVYEKMLAITVWKGKYFNDHPYDAKILLEAFTNPPKEIKLKMSQEMNQMVKLSLNQFFHEIDMNQFSSEYTKEEVLLFIQITLVGLQNSLIKPGMSFEDIDNIKDQSMKYLKTVIKGMEK